MNPYLSGIMALSQLSPEQFDMGMQRFQQIQQMQPQGLSALQARQDSEAILQGPSSLGQAYRGEVRDSSGNVVRPAYMGQLGQMTTGQISELQKRNNSYPNIPAGFTASMSTGNSTSYTNPQTGESFSISGQMSGNPTMSEIRPAPEGFQPPPPQPLNERQIRFSRLQNGATQGPATGITQGPYSQPTMSPFSNTQGSFGTGAMPYTQPYYQRSFNPYSGGYGMGFGGGMPSYGGFGGGKGGGQPMYGGFGGGKGGRR